MAASLTSAQIEQVIASGYPAAKKSAVNNLWQAYNSVFKTNAGNFDTFVSYIRALRTIASPSQCPSIISSFSRAVYLEVSNMKERVLDCDAVYDCIYNRMNGLKESMGTAFSCLDGLNPKRPNYWHRIMMDPISDCSWSYNACEALVKAHVNAIRTAAGTYKKQTPLPDGYYFFNESPGSGRMKIGDFYFRKTF